MPYKLVVKKRMEGTSGNVFLAQGIGVFLALLTVTIFLLFSGKSFMQVLNILDSLIIQSFFSKYGFFDTMNKSIPLIITGLGISLAFKMKLWNIGGEGQIMMGALAAGGVAIYFPNMAGIPLTILMILAALMAGALWALIAAIPKAYFEVNETIVTLMLNYIAILVVTYFVYGPWRDPSASGFPIAPPLPQAAWFSYILGTPLQTGLLLAFALCAIYGYVLSKSRWGYDIRVIGESQKSAKYAGIDVKLNIILVMLVSGALAGLAGYSQLVGNTHRLEVGLSNGYGYTAIIIAWLSRMNPFGVIFMSIFMAGLFVGGTAVRTEGVPAAVSIMIQGCILLFVLACDSLTKYSFKLVKEAK